MGVGWGGRRGPWSPPPHWIFIDGTYKVDKGLIVLFFGHFYYFSDFFGCPSPSPPGRGLIVLFFSRFFRCSSPSENFSTDALDYRLHTSQKTETNHYVIILILSQKYWFYLFKGKEGEYSVDNLDLGPHQHTLQ